MYSECTWIYRRFAQNSNIFADLAEFFAVIKFCILVFNWSVLICPIAYCLTCIAYEYHIYNCVNSVFIRSFSGPYFPALGLNWDTKYLSVFTPNAGKHGPEKLRIRTVKSIIFHIELSMIWINCSNAEKGFKTISCLFSKFSWDN